MRGIGRNDTGTDITENGKHTRLYSLWQGMLARCYNKKLHEKFPTYRYCEVCENFKSRSYFEDWCKKQKGFELGWETDKDLLFKNNKLYSEATCVFLPREINGALKKCDASRGKCCIGVCFHKTKGKFQSLLRKHGKLNFLGLFSTEEEAFLAYKTAKEDYLKELAEKHKANLDPKAYQALINYTVEIGD